MRNTQETDSERNRAADDGLTILQQVVHGTQTHLLTDLFTEGDQRNTNNGRNLVHGLLLVFLMLSAHVQQLLDVEHVTRAGIGAGLHDESD